VFNSNTLQDILKTIFPANLFTGAKHSAFSTNHLTDIIKTKHNDNQPHKNPNNVARRSSMHKKA